MKMLLIPVLLLFLFAPPALAQTGDAEAGRALWASGGASAAGFCNNCHGKEGNGGFGPDLAGRGLTLAQFTRAIRQPWGVMPAYSQEQISDKDIANLYVYFASRPAAAGPDPPRTAFRTGVSHGEMVFDVFGCLQCHEPRWTSPRSHAGAVGADFTWFTKVVYEHSSFMPAHRPNVGEGPGPVRMGNYSRLRLLEPFLRAAWDSVVAIGLRPRIDARFAAPQRSDKGITYTVNVGNVGMVGKGLAAEDVSVAVTVPAGMKVLSAEGADVRPDTKTGEQVVTWKVKRISPQDKQTYTLTAAGESKDNPKAVVRWSKPVEKDATGKSMGGEQNVAPPPRS